MHMDRLAGGCACGRVREQILGIISMRVFCVFVLVKNIAVLLPTHIIEDCLSSCDVSDKDFVCGDNTQLVHSHVIKHRQVYVCFL